MQQNISLKAAYTIDEAAVQSGICRVKLYSEIRSGRLVARKCGTRTLILAADLEEWLSNLPTTLPVKE